MSQTLLCVTVAALAVAAVTLILAALLYRRLRSALAMLQEHTSNQTASLQGLARFDHEQAASWQARNQPIGLLASGHADLATRLYQRAVNAYQQQKFPAARCLWQWALTHYQCASEIESESACRVNIALCLRAEGDVQQALAMMEALHIVSLEAFPDKPLALDIQRNLAELKAAASGLNAVQLFSEGRNQMRTGKPQEALTFFDRAANSCQNDKNLRTRILINRAVCHEQLFQYSEACSLIGEALKLANEGALEGDREAEDLLRDHLVRIKDGMRCQSALKLSRRCVPLMEKQQWAEAETLAQQALDEADNAIGREHQLSAHIMHQLALCKFHLEQVSEAHDLWQEAAKALAICDGISPDVRAAVQGHIEACRERLGD